MKNIKKFIIPGTIALTILGSSTVFAAGNATSTDNTGDTTTTQMTQGEGQEGVEGRGGRGGKGGSLNSEDREGKRIERQETQAAILEDAEALVPGSIDEIEAVQEELSNSRDALQEERDALREKVESGEITREEMQETKGDKIDGRGNGSKEAKDEDNDRPANSWDELQEAIEAGDKDAVLAALDSILEHMNDSLANMDEKLSVLQ
ncbi:hypothetical protein [Clostridium sp. DL1XJH146]